MTTLRAGAASDVGKVRRNNQDQFLVDEPLYAVADGMGGAAGGAEASQTAVAALKEVFASDPTADGLADGVRGANRAVWELAREHPELRGMGTTMTAVALVTGDGAEGEVLAVANVGDSRVYLLRDGRLDQITEDHSVPEELVRAGRISPEEAASHPQRNMLTRVLGNEPEVEVDCFAIIPYSGDRLVLASDGLFNEVDHEEITSVARRQPDPQEAAAELVQMARDSGGNDNITVVVVDVVDDDDRAAKASASVATTPPPPARGTAAAPSPAPPGGRSHAAGSTDATGTRRSTPTATAAGHTATAPATRVGEPVSATPSHWSAPRPQPADDGPSFAGPGLSPERHEKRFTIRVAVFLVALLLVVVGAAGAVGYFARAGYFVGIDNGEVVVFKGRPGGLLWFEPTVSQRTGLNAADVPAARLAAVEEGKKEPNLSAAERYVANLKDQAAAATTTTTTTTVPVTPPSTATPAPSVSTP